MGELGGLRGLLRLGLGWRGLDGGGAGWRGVDGGGEMEGLLGWRDQAARSEPHKPNCKKNRAKRNRGKTHPGNRNEPRLYWFYYAGIQHVSWSFAVSPSSPCLLHPDVFAPPFRGREELRAGSGSVVGSSLSCCFVFVAQRVQVPNTSALWSQKAIKGMVFGTSVLIYWVLEPSGLLCVCCCLLLCICCASSSCWRCCLRLRGLQG